MKVNYLKYNTKRIKLLTNFKKRKKITKKYAFLDNLLRLYQIRFRFRLGSHHSLFRLVLIFQQAFLCGHAPSTNSKR